MKSWFPHGFCFVLVNGTKSNFGNLPPKFTQYQWIVTLKADVQEEEIWKKKLLEEVAGGVGEMAFLTSFSRMFCEFCSVEAWIDRKNIYIFICTLRENVPSEYFPAPSENLCPTTLFFWDDGNILNNVYFLKFWSSFAGGSQGFCWGL